MAQLKHTSSAGDTCLIPLKEKNYTIGTSRDSDIKIEGEGLFHARLSHLHSGSFELENLGGAAEILVNSLPVQFSIIRDNDLIEFGNNKFVYSENSFAEDTKSTDEIAQKNKTAKTKVDAKTQSLLLPKVILSLNQKNINAYTSSPKIAENDRKIVKFAENDGKLDTKGENYSKNTEKLSVSATSSPKIAENDGKIVKLAENDGKKDTKGENYSKNTEKLSVSATSSPKIAENDGKFEKIDENSFFDVKKRKDSDSEVKKGEKFTKNSPEKDKKLPNSAAEVSGARILPKKTKTANTNKKVNKSDHLLEICKKIELMEEESSPGRYRHLLNKKLNKKLKKKLKNKRIVEDAKVSKNGTASLEKNLAEIVKLYQKKTKSGNAATRFSDEEIHERDLKESILQNLLDNAKRRINSKKKEYQEVIVAIKKARSERERERAEFKKLKLQLDSKRNALELLLRDMEEIKIESAEWKRRLEEIKTESGKYDAKMANLDSVSNNIRELRHQRQRLLTEVNALLEDKNNARGRPLPKFEPPRSLVLSKADTRWKVDVDEKRACVRYFHKELETKLLALQVCLEKSSDEANSVQISILQNKLDKNKFELARMSEDYLINEKLLANLRAEFQEREKSFLQTLRPELSTAQSLTLWRINFIESYLSKQKHSDEKYEPTNKDDSTKKIFSQIAELCGQKQSNYVKDQDFKQELDKILKQN